MPETAKTYIDRYDISCPLCGLIGTACRLDEAIRSATNGQRVHATCHSDITIFDRMAQRGSVELRLADGTWLRRRQKDD